MAHTRHLLGRSESKPGKRISSVGSNMPPQPSATSSQAHPAAQAAAAKAMYSGQERMLPTVRHESDLSTDLQHLTVSNAAGQQPFSEDVADRNIERRKPRAETRKPVSAQPNGGMATKGSVKPLVPGGQRYSEDVANWNIVQNERPLVGGMQGMPPPLNVKKRSSTESPPVSPTLSHKPDVGDLRRSSGSPTVRARSPKRSLDAGYRSIRRSSLDKPLPSAPSDEYAAEIDGDQAVQHDSNVHSALGRERGYLVKDAKAPIDLKGIVDLRNTEDTTLHERWAPAVTHETIIQNVHEIREERITREIHNHHIFHRILPIVDIEVLPARHFVPTEGGYAEIAEEEVPGRAGPNAQWVIAEKVSKLLPQSKGPIVPQHFTARKFEGKDGDYKEYITPEGFKRTETTWVHPPTIEMGGMHSGQTYPFYIGSPNPADDGLRARMPEGNVIGVSPLLAQQQRERLRSQQEGMVTEGQGEAPPPVPIHKSFPAEMVDSARAGPAKRYA